MAKTRFAVSLSQDGEPRLELRDAAGTPRIMIGFDPDGDPGIAFFDKSGQYQASIGLDGTTFGVFEPKPKAANGKSKSKTRPKCRKTSRSE